METDSLVGRTHRYLGFLQYVPKTDGMLWVSPKTFFHSHLRLPYYVIIVLVMDYFTHIPIFVLQSAVCWSDSGMGKDALGGRTPRYPGFDPTFS